MTAIKLIDRKQWQLMGESRTLSAIIWIKSRQGLSRLVIEVSSQMFAMKGVSGGSMSAGLVSVL